MPTATHTRLPDAINPRSRTTLGYQLPGRILVDVSAKLYSKPVQFSVWVPDGYQQDRATLLRCIGESMSTAGLSEINLQS